MKFKVGDKIFMIGNWDGAKRGSIGEIRGYDKEFKEYAVFFDKLKNMSSSHDCNGIIPEGGGQYVPENCMELLEETQSSPIMRFTSQQQLEESLAEWQSRLLLSDWIIMAKLVSSDELVKDGKQLGGFNSHCLLYTSPSPRDA